MKFTNNLPTGCTIRGDWHERKLFIDDEFIALTRNYGSDAGFFEITALSILCHYLPQRIALQFHKGFARYVAKFPAEDFELKNVNLRKEVLNAQKNEVNYAY